MDCDGRLGHVVDDAMSKRDQESKKKKKGSARVLRSQHGTILHGSGRKMQKGRRGRGRGRGGHYYTAVQYCLGGDLYLLTCARCGAFLPSHVTCHASDQAVNARHG